MAVAQTEAFLKPLDEQMSFRERERGLSGDNPTYSRHPGWLGWPGWDEDALLKEAAWLEWLAWLALPGFGWTVN